MRKFFNESIKGKSPHELCCSFINNEEMMSHASEPGILRLASDRIQEMLKRYTPTSDRIANNDIPGDKDLFTFLPLDLMVKIIEYIPGYTLLNLLCTCQYLNITLTNTDNVGFLWKDKVKREFLHFRTSSDGVARYQHENPYMEYMRHLLSYYPKKSTSLRQMEFSLAVANNDFATVKRILIDTLSDESAKSVKKLIGHQRDVDGCTSIMIAVANNNVKMARFLLEIYPKTKTFSKFGDSALTYACKNNNPNMVSMLFNNGDTVKDMDGNKRLPLHTAAIHGANEVISLLISHGADVDALTGDDMWNSTSLYFACMRGHEQAVIILLQNGANTEISNNGPDYGDGTALHIAAYRGDLPIVKQLIHHGADIDNKSNGRQRTVLIEAIDFPDIVRFLLSKGVNINDVNSAGNTALHLACECGFLETVQLLLNSHGINIDAENDKGLTPLNAMCHSRVCGEEKKTAQLAILELLLVNGADTKKVDNARKNCVPQFVEFIEQYNTRHSSMEMK